MQPQRRWQEEKERHSNVCLWGLQEPLNISLLVFSECVCSWTTWFSTLHQRMTKNIKEGGDILLSMTLALWPCSVLVIISPIANMCVIPVCIYMSVCICCHTHTQKISRGGRCLTCLTCPARESSVLVSIHTPIRSKRIQHLTLVRTIRHTARGGDGASNLVKRL